MSRQMNANERISQGFEQGKARRGTARQGKVGQGRTRHGKGFEQPRELWLPRMVSPTSINPKVAMI